MVEIAVRFSRYEEVRGYLSDRLFWRLLEALEREDPGEDATLAEIKEWHMRRVVATSGTYQEAAEKLDVSKRMLWEHRSRWADNGSYE